MTAFHDRNRMRGVSGGNYRRPGKNLLVQSRPHQRMILRETHRITGAAAPSGYGEPLPRGSSSAAEQETARLFLDHVRCDPGEAPHTVGTGTVLVAGAADKGKLDDADIWGERSGPPGHIWAIDSDGGRAQRIRSW